MQPSEDLDSAMLKTCRPLGVEVYELLNPDDILKDWKPPEAAVQMYGGLHGMKMPMWAEKKH